MNDITAARDISGLEPMGVLRGITPLCVPYVPAGDFAEEARRRADPRIEAMWQRLGLIYLFDQQPVPVSNTTAVVNNFTANLIFRVCTQNHTDRLIERYQPGFVFPESFRRAGQEQLTLIRTHEIRQVARAFSDNRSYTEEMSRVFRLVFEKETGGIPLQTVCRALAALLGSTGGGAVFSAQQQRIFERIADVLGNEYPESPAAREISGMGAASGFTKEQRERIIRAAGVSGSRPQTEAVLKVIELAESGKSADEISRTLLTEVRKYALTERRMTENTPQPEARRSAGIIPFSGNVSSVMNGRTIMESAVRHELPAGAVKPLTGSLSDIAEVIFRDHQTVFVNTDNTSDHSSYYIRSVTNDLTRLVTERIISSSESKRSGTAIPAKSAGAARSTVSAAYAGNESDTSDIVQPAESVTADVIPSEKNAIAPESDFTESVNITKLLSERAEKISRLIARTESAVAHYSGSGIAWLTPAAQHDEPYSQSRMIPVNESPADVSVRNRQVSITPRTLLRLVDRFSGGGMLSAGYSQPDDGGKISAALNETSTLLKTYADNSSHYSSFSANVSNKFTGLTEHTERTERIPGTVKPAEPERESRTETAHYITETNPGESAEHSERIERTNHSDHFERSSLTERTEQTERIPGTVKPAESERESRTETAHYITETRPGESAEHSERIERTNHSDHFERSSLTERTEQTERIPGTVKPAEPERESRTETAHFITETRPGESVEHSERIERTNHSDRTEHSRLTERTEKTERISGTVKPAESERESRTETAHYITETRPGESAEHSERIERTNHSDRTERSSLTEHTERTERIPGTIKPAESERESRTETAHYITEPRPGESAEPKPAVRGSYRERLDSGTLAALDELIRESRGAVHEVKNTAPEETQLVLAESTEKAAVQSGSELRNVSIVRESIVRKTESHMSRLIAKAAQSQMQSAQEKKPFTIRTADNAQNMVMLIPPSEMDRFQAQQYMNKMPPIELKEPQSQPQEAPANRTITTDRHVTRVQTISDSGVDSLTREDISRLADKVYERIETKLSRERRRMGL